MGIMFEIQNIQGGLMKYKIKTFAPFLALLFFSCADQIVSECGDESHGNNMRARFSAIQQELLTPTCAKAGCHSGLTPTAGLNLEAGNAYVNLIDENSTQESAFKLVRPFNSDSSWIIHKMRAQGTTVMPPSGNLPQAVIDSVAAWIDNGALND